MGKTVQIARRLVCLPIKLYQFIISPLIAPSCRYYPSCSQYSVSAIVEYGVIKGIWMGLKRILRCHPWSKGGYDPIHPNDEKI